MKPLDRKKINRMVSPQSSQGGNGGGQYTPSSQSTDWSDIQNKPTTIAGYGITDAYWANQQSTSDKRNLTIGSVTQQVITQHQSLNGYATESWVNNKGYLTSVSWGDISGKPSAYPPESHSHSWGSITSKPTSKTAWGKTFWDSNGDPQSISGSLSSVGNISFDQSGRNIGSLIYFDTANSRVGIGTNSPSTKFSVAGSIYASGGFTFLSDIRKKNVIDYDQKLTVEDIANAPLIHYTLKDDKEQRVQVGSVAQYWEEKLPETVLKDEEGTLSMQYDVQAHTAAIVLARKVLEMQKEIDELKKKLNGK